MRRLIGMERCDVCGDLVENLNDFFDHLRREHADLYNRQTPPGDDR
ncbi:hypothetical protein [Longimycelium tulufanense]|nr:hypothetical protein [Longimycelium tulufanense]